MTPNYDALRFYLELGNCVGLVMVSIYVWLSSRQKANSSAIEALKESVTDDRAIIETRFARLESEIKHLPTHNDIGEVYERVNAVGETLSEVKGQLAQMNNVLAMINQHLIGQGPRA